MEIIYDISEISQDNIVAPLYVKIGGHEFPGDSWTDFIIGVLGMWMENLNAMLDDPQESPPMQNRYQLSFLDGPWTILIERVQDHRDQLLLRASQKIPGSHMDENVEFSLRATETIAIDELVSIIVQVGVEVMNVCHSKEIGVKNPDVSFMAESLGKLRRIRDKKLKGERGQN